MATDVRNINGKKMKIRTYDGKRVLTNSDIDVIFGFNNNRCSARFRDVLKKKGNKGLIKGEDYFTLPREVFSLYSDKHSAQPAHIITETGFKKMTDIMDSYLRQWTLNCYYNDGVKPDKPEVKETNVPKEKKEDVKQAVDDKKNNQSEQIVSVSKLLDNMSEFIILQQKILEEQNKAHIQFLSDLTRILTKANVNTNVNYTNDDIVFSDYDSFKKHINKVANDVISNNHKFKSTNEVLTEAYRQLRNQYGVVYEQYKKDYKEANNSSPVSTLELEWWIEKTVPCYVGLLESKLKTLAERK